MFRSVNLVTKFNSSVVNYNFTLRAFSSAMADARVKIPQGELQGKTDKTLSGGTFFSFQGIPYAKPPIGPLRFRPPEAAETWTGIRDATKEGNVCPQTDLLTRKVIGNEDCLFLNVYTPKLKPEVQLPVMVFIHGGGYIMGSGNSDFFGANFLVDKDVILVTLNYRFGPFGFLQLDIPKVPGNAGLRDQVAALQWIQKNITYFGGDPNNVTLFGESAGSSSVHYLMLSPMGRGLFHRTILQSGTALSEWAFTRRGLERGLLLAKYTGKETTTAEETLEYLQSLPTEVVLKNQFKTKSDDDRRRFTPLPFTVAIEKEFEGVPVFLSKDPASIMQSGEYNKVPFIIGYNEKEGIGMIMDGKKKLNDMENDFERTIPKYLNLELGTEESKKVAQQIRDVFFGNKPVSLETVPNVVDWLSDFHFLIGIYQSIGMHLKTSDLPIYMYRFEFVGMLNIFKVLLGGQELDGACHGDEMFYIFKQNVMDIPVKEHEESYNTIKRMVQMWTDFAKYGNPTPKTSDIVNLTWTPLSKSKQTYDYLGIATNLEIGTDADKKRLDLWRELFTKYNGDFLKPKV